MRNDVELGAIWLSLAGPWSYLARMSEGFPCFMAWVAMLACIVAGSMKLLEVWMRKKLEKLEAKK